jgi:hypothetical protein
MKLALVSVTYSLVRVSEDCSIRRTGFGGRELRLRSPRATGIRVTRGAAGLVYRPSRLLARVTGRATRIRVLRGPDASVS